MGDTPIDLDERRDLRGLLRATFRLYRAHLGTVLAGTGAIVVVIDLIMGAGLNQIGSRYQSHPKGSVSTIEVLVSLFVLTPLINATHAQLVLDVAEGRGASARRAVQRALDVFAPALVAVLLYAAAVFVGLALILPGIYLAVLWYFATQSVAVEGRRALGALRRSGELVTGQWLRVLGYITVITAIGLAPGLLLGSLIDDAARAVDAQMVSLVGTMLVQIFSLSFVALAAALLFFDLRAGRRAA